MYPSCFSQGHKIFPLPTATLVFIDGSSNGTVAYSINGHISKFQTTFKSAQSVEMVVILEVFKPLYDPFNIYTDSVYVEASVPLLETVPYIKPNTNVSPLFFKLQQLILARTQPFYLSHIRAHSSLPGPLAEGNSFVDQATQAFFVLTELSPVSATQQAHKLHHFNAQNLRNKFKITREQARQIVKSCKNCLSLLPEPHLALTLAVLCLEICGKWMSRIMVLLEH